jgi:hypothetical protein
VSNGNGGFGDGDGNGANVSHGDGYEAAYANGQHTNVLKQCVCVNYGCAMQFEVAISLNHDLITSF